jgi:hypothetical protein
MKGGDAEKLLGGYAAGTLTPEERQALFAAALEDQRLYEALVREDPVRELLADPAARAAVLAALDEVPKPWYYRDVHPGIIAAAVSAVVIVTLGVKFWPVRTAPPLSVVAQAELPQPAKSDLPTELLFERQPAAAQKAPPKLPAPPVIPAAPAAPRLEPAAEAVLAQSSVRPSPPDAPAPVAAVSGSVLPKTVVFRAAASAPLAVRYTILKKLFNGQFAPVDPGQELDAGDETVIRLEPAESGFLYVLERSVAGDWRPVVTDRVEPSVPYTVPKNGTFRAEGSGPREFLVLFSRQPQNLSSRDQPAIAAAQDQRVRAENAATYVASASTAASQQVSFRVTLKYK